MTTPAKVLASRQQRRRKGNLYDPHCPSRVVLDHITSRWGSLVLLTLLDGTQRFSELVRGIGGVSEKMLAQSLKALEADGLVLRTVYPTIPPKVEYSLTSLGSEVAEHIKTLTNWVEDNVSEVMRHRTKHSSLETAPVPVSPSTSPMRR
ncbi:winged helix-turn-helix transcriptional regulator [Tunturibacter empetritectus]|uniref:DNA-binding HxlR family transcriptional regulator n=1 Tax=Tunturiibacter lichenicola TaxID=2051959 RepID=A0A7W8N4J4_9BACT|nr:helix-turn-helix domain-containing protein [Edaphobacter lichenicola]MBB5342995.1 DNA-binding HxlR family transcriptional regulator [Edaphobacter lichenicola]